MDIQLLAAEIHANARAKGFYDAPVNVPEKLMLVVCEVSEAVEAHRKGQHAAGHPAMQEKQDMIDDLTRGATAVFLGAIKDTFEDEMADAIIRLLDLCEYLDIDIAFHIQAKMKYNATRERLHGKAY